MYTDKHCGTENKYQNIKDNNNNKFSSSNDMFLLFTLFFDQPPGISAILYIFVM